MPGSIDVRIDRFQQPRQPRLDPQSSIAGNEISKSRFMNALRYLSPRYLSQFFRRKSTPIVETPPPHPSIKKKSGKKSGTKSPIKKRNSAKTTKRAFPDEYYSPRHASTLHQTTTETERAFPDEYYSPRHASTLHQTTTETERVFPDEYYYPRHTSTLHQTTTETERVFPDEYYYPRHTSTLHQKISKKARKLQSTRRLRSSAS